MNILIVVNNFNVGGLERVVITLLKALKKTNNKVYCCCLEGEGELYPQVSQYVDGSLVLDKRSGIDVLSIFSIRKYISCNNIDVIHTHNLAPLVYAGLASKLFFRKINHVYTEHNQVSRLNEQGMRKFSKYLKLADKVVTVSTALKEMFQNKLNVKHVDVVYNGIDPSDFSCGDSVIRKEFELAESDFILCLIGILKPQKGIIYLLQAMSSLLEYKDIKLLIVGDGSLRDELVSYAEKNKIVNVIFAGYRTDLCEIYNAADVTVMSSLQEGLPMALIESIAAGKPVITTDVGGCTEVIKDGENGVVVKPKSPDALKHAILAMYESKELSGYTKKNKEKFNDLFSDVSMRDKYLDLYSVNR